MCLHAFFVILVVKYGVASMTIVIIKLLGVTLRSQIRWLKPCFVMDEWIQDLPSYSLSETIAGISLLKPCVTILVNSVWNLCFHCDHWNPAVSGLSISNPTLFWVLNFLKVHLHIYKETILFQTQISEVCSVWGMSVGWTVRLSFIPNKVSQE